MTLAIVTVCDSISKLSVMGVTIKDVDEIPSDCSMLLPVLFPEPVNLMTDFTMTRDSFGGGSVAKMTVGYNLHYTFCLAPVGSGFTGLEYFDETLTKVAAILDAVLAIDTFAGAIDITPQEATEFGPVPDPAGKQYIGCRLTFHVEEFVN